VFDKLKKEAEKKKIEVEKLGKRTVDIGKQAGKKVKNETEKTIHKVREKTKK
jgi:hypothetical protein